MVIEWGDTQIQWKTYYFNKNTQYLYVKIEIGVFFVHFYRDSIHLEEWKEGVWAADQL